MSIVLRENDWAAMMVKGCTLGKKPSETLRRVARYYMDAYGTSPEATRKKLDLFLLQCDPTASIPKWSAALDYAVSRASKYPAICIDSIPITDTEMKKIDSLEIKQHRRLAFTLLCLSKYWGMVTGKHDRWVNSKDNEIMAMANIRTSIKRQSVMYGTLNELGMIQFSRKVDNTNVRVCFAEEGKEIMRITDLRNLGYQYLMYHGEPYFTCPNCGITTKVTNGGNKRNQKYCQECASILRMQQNIDSVMRCRVRSLLNVGHLD